jgi:hypothetical protein
LLAHGWWFSLASSTTKTGRHEILLKVALSTIKSNQILKMRGDCFVDIETLSLAAVSRVHPFL